MAETLAARSTGNYNVVLLDDGESYSLLITYLGAWASGSAVEVVLDDDDEPEEVVRRFDRVRGDFDVEAILAAGGFDQFTNVRGRPGVARL